MEVNKWKKKKEKSRLEGDLSTAYLCCNQLGDAYFNDERYDDALNEYNEMKQIAIETNNKLDIARADRMIGEVFCLIGEFSKAISHQKNYLSISRSEHDKIEEQRALATLGRTYLVLADNIADPCSEKNFNALNEAKKFFMKSLEVCHELTEESIGNKQRMEMTARLYLNLGLVLDSQNQFGDSIKYMLKAVSICRNLDLWEDLYRTYAALGPIYHKHNDRQEALRIYDLTLNVAERLSDKLTLVCETLIHKAEVLLDFPDLRGARQALLRGYKLKPTKQPLREEIEKKLRTVAAMCEFEEKLTELPPDGCFPERKQLYENMGDAASSLNNYSLALTYYHLMLECVQKCGNKKEDLIASYVSLAQTYKDNNQLDNALKYFKKELELEQENSTEACKTMLNIAEINQLMGNSEEMFLTYNKAKSIAYQSNDVKLKKTILEAFYDVLVKYNKISEAEEIKRELNSFEMDILVELSDEEEEILDNIPFGADISLDALSDEENVATDASKKSRLSRTRSRQKSNLEKKNEKGETPLHVAAINGNANLVQRLIEQGHRVDVKDYSGWTPLHEACNHGHKEVVQILLDNKAPVNDRGGTHCDGVTPLLDAASNGSLDVMELLLSYGASPLMRTNNGETVLDCLSSWRERRYNELGVDLDSVTRAQYDSIFNNLKQIFEKAGQKLSSKNKSETNYQQSSRSLTTRLSSSSSLGKNSSQTKNTGQEKKESTTEDYQNTMKSLRRRFSNEKAPSSRQLTNQTPFPALLVEEDNVGDDWLDDDIELNRPHKKRRIDHFIMEGRNKENLFRKRSKSTASSDESDGDKSTGNLTPDIIDDNSEEIDQLTRMNREIEDSIASTQKSEESYRERFKELTTNSKKKQTSLLSAGIIKEKAVKSNINSNFSLQSNDLSLFNPKPNFSFIKVRIEDKTIVVPVPQSSFDSLSISWLAQEAADRYRRLEGSEPVLRLEMEDGGLLVDSDPLAILLGVHQIQARVLSWKALSLTGLYKEACDIAGIQVDPEVNNILEACPATGFALLDYVYLDHKQMTPIFHALSHHPPLQVLSIAGSNISDNLVLELGACVAKLTQLRSLDLSNINITSKGLDAFYQQVKKREGLPKLEKLKLGYNPLGDCLRTLAELVSLIPRLRYLSLPSVGITSRSFSSFIQFTLEYLEVLDLSFNDIGGEGLTDILGRLEAQTVVELRFAATGPQTIREVGFYLQHYSPLSLRTLDLSYCSADQLELDCLFKGISMCKHLEKLMLDGLGGQASITIGDLTVKEVSLCGTRITTGASLPAQLKKLSLTSNNEESFSVKKGPFGLCKLNI